MVEVELGGGNQLEVVAVTDPLGLDPDAAQHLEDPVDLFDPGHAAKHGSAVVEQAGAEQGDGGVLAGTDVDGTGQLLAAADPQVGRADRAELHQPGVECFADAGQHLEADVLPPLLHPGDGALAGAEGLGELDLGPAAVLAGVSYQRADTMQVVICHRITVSHI